MRTPPKSLAAATAVAWVVDRQTIRYGTGVVEVIIHAPYFSSSDGCYKSRLVLSGACTLDQEIMGETPKQASSLAKKVAMLTLGLD